MAANNPSARQNPGAELVRPDLVQADVIRADITRADVTRADVTPPEIQRLGSIREVVSQLRDVLLDPELSCSVEVLNAARPRLEAAIAELAAWEPAALRELSPRGFSPQGASSRSDPLNGNDLNFRVSQQLQLLHAELHSAEALRANASEFWKSWSKLLGIDSNPAGTSYSPSGLERSIAILAASGNVSVRG